MILTPEELADRWRVPRSQIYRLSRAGAIPLIQVGRYYRYRLELIEEYERGEWKAAA